MCSLGERSRRPPAVRRRDGRQPGCRPAGVRARAGARSGGAGRRTSHRGGRRWWPPACPWGPRWPVLSPGASGAGLDGHGDHRPPTAGSVVGSLCPGAGGSARGPVPRRRALPVRRRCTRGHPRRVRRSVGAAAPLVDRGADRRGALCRRGAPHVRGAQRVGGQHHAARHVRRAPAPRRRAAAASAGRPAGGDGGTRPAVRLVAVVPGHRRHDPQHPRRVDPGVVLRALLSYLRRADPPAERIEIPFTSGTTRQCTSLPRCHWLGAGSGSST